MYKLISRFYPEKIRQKYKKVMVYSGVNINSERFIGFVVYFSFLFSLIVALFSAAIFKIYYMSLIFLAIIILTFVITQVLVFFMLMLKSDAKSKFVEEILPDVLQLMASNLRSGLTTDKALLLAARPEFGDFQNEINRVGKEITIGKDIADALLEMTERIDSDRLKKTIVLIVSGLKSGGELASLLDQTARNLRQEMLVDSRIRANVMMYVILIFIAVCFGAPLLFGMSSFLVEFLVKTMASLQLPEETSAQMPINFSGISIGTDFILMFSVIFLVTSSIFGSLIIGSISKGKEREGLKFIPILLLASLGIFFLIRYVITYLFGSIFGI